MLWGQALGEGTEKFVVAAAAAAEQRAPGGWQRRIWEVKVAALLGLVCYRQGGKRQ